ncbi:efflux RND transporter permease subunit [Horticoccus sp. 23ND18S-11]|uniref:efflux RND transporter permease subunit n=1 Tax=Horticoccus sp. 23ND18S-11 TaxID=3391832 RepID=UPI0039C9A82B
MNFLQLALRRPLSVVVLVIAVALAAGLAIQRMSRDIFPPLGIPTIYVAQPYGGMDPAQMEGYLTYRYEYHFLYISGIEHVESKSIQGASIMKLQFHPGTDMSQALSETIAYVNRSRAFMPEGTPAPFVTRFDAGSVAVGYLVFSTNNPNRTLNEMQDQALNRVRPAFATLPGVSAPPPFGGSSRGIIVNVDPERMRAYGLSPDEIVKALLEGNKISPSGNMNLGDKYPIVEMNSIVKNPKDLEALMLRRNDDGAVYVRDVATIVDGADITTAHALANGLRTVYLPVTKRSDASTLAVVDLVKKNIPEFQKILPDDIKVSYVFDQSPVVNRSINDVLKEGGLGAILTGLMVLLFLRDWRSAFVVVINIPLSLLGAVFALWITGETIHLMTLGGLALAIGILVDESTVAVENIHAHIARGASVSRAALDGTRETALPRLLAMLCILAVFIPAFFMVGAAKALFVPMALAVGFSMIASYLLSSTLVPILSVWLLRGHSAEIHDASFFAKLQRGYAGILRGAVAMRWPLALVYLVACGAIVWIFGARLGTEIFPKTDNGQFALRLRAPSGTRVDLTEAIAKKVLDTIAREAGGADKIDVTIGMVGVHNSSFPVNLVHLWNGGPEEGWLAIQLKPHTGIRIEEFKEKLRAVFARDLPDVRFSFEPQDIVSRVMSFGSSTPVEIAISGSPLPVSKAYADQIIEKMKAIPYLRDIQIAQTLDYPTVAVNVDRERAGQLGVQMSDVSRSLVAATTSSRFTTPIYWADPGSGISFSLQVQIPESKTTSMEDLGNVPVVSNRGAPVLLRNIATLAPGTAVGTYERYNLARLVSITANIYGSDLGTATRAIRKAIADAGPLPQPSTKVDLRGQVVPLEQLLDGFRSGLIIAVIVIFLMLSANFESLRLAFAVVSTVPAVLAGVVLALYFTGTTLNIQSAMGAIMSVGVAVANAILLVTFAERSRLQSSDALAAAVEGGRSRLRPILMTSFAMIAGMLPLALGLGEGGDQTAPLGRAVVGGLALATLATLFVLPAFFAIIRRRASTRSGSLDPDDPLSGHFRSPVGHN